MLAVIIANVLFSIKGFNDEMFFRKYQFHVGSIRAGEQIRMITSAFLHADIMHLAFNMITLYFFAPIVIQTLGDFSFILIYFISYVYIFLLDNSFEMGYSKVARR